MPLYDDNGKEAKKEVEMVPVDSVCYTRKERSRERVKAWEGRDSSGYPDLVNDFDLLKKLDQIEAEIKKEKIFNENPFKKIADYFYEKKTTYTDNKPSQNYHARYAHFVSMLAALAQNTFDAVAIRKEIELFKGKNLFSSEKYYELASALLGLKSSQLNKSYNEFKAGYLDKYKGSVLSDAVQSRLSEGAGAERRGPPY